MDIDLNQFRSIFFEEAAEHLASMETALLQLESAPQDLELLHSVFRGAHSIKGGSGMYNLSDITRFTHAMESLLDVMRDGKITVTSALTDLLLRSTDILRALVTIAQDGGELPSRLEDTVKELQQALNGGTAPSAPESSPSSAPTQRTHAIGEYRIVFKPGCDLFRQGMEPALLLRELAGMGEILTIAVDLSQLPYLTYMDPESCYLQWTLTLKTEKTEKDIRDVFAFVEDISEISIDAESRGSGQGSTEKEVVKKGIEPQQEASPVPVSAVDTRPPTPDPAGGGRNSGGESTSIRVSTEKVDKLINLVGELVISQSMISQMIHNFSPQNLHNLREAITEMERNTRELQERVMAVRMLPIGNVFSRYPRMVRDLASTLNKKISVQMIGEETELDKSVIERIGDPLTHLVRNAADHGLEAPQERLQAGKPEQGTLRLQAFHQGGNVIIEVSDDGRGLNTERIRQKAITNGLISAEENLTEEQIHALIFQPGFSTATVVSDVSGRGVGMDVVKRNIESLNGTVSIFSEAGKGSRIRIKLPLTLAIIDGLLLRVGEDVYVMPLLAIVESIRPQAAQVKAVLGRGEVVMVRGEFLPLTRLHQLFDISSAAINPSKGLVVIVENEGRKFGLLVDEILGQSQVVIKNLETNYRKIEGIVGATIMGDGRVALILDVQGLARIAMQGGIGGYIPRPEVETAPENHSVAFAAMDSEMYDTAA